MAPAPVQEQVSEPTMKLDAALEKDLESVFASFDKEEAQEEEEEDLASLFAMDDDDEDEGATRILNLDDLQFGRNYNKD